MIQQVRCQLLITVCVPKKQLWQFLELFGKEFAFPSVDDLGREFKSVRAVEMYEDDPRTPDNAWVTVKLHPESAQKFASFCDSFPVGQGLQVDFSVSPLALLARAEDRAAKC